MTTSGGRPAGPANERLTTVDGLAQLSFLIQGTLERRSAEHDVSITQTRLLGVLRDRRPTINELAQLLELDKSSVSGLVDRAERRGLVTRIRSARDRRAVQVELTDRGRDLVELVATAFEADVAGLVGHLSASALDGLSGTVSDILLAHARRQGVDLFATEDLGRG